MQWNLKDISRTEVLNKCVCVCIVTQRSCPGARMRCGVCRLRWWVRGTTAAPSARNGCSCSRRTSSYARTWRSSAKPACWSKGRPSSRCVCVCVSQTRKTSLILTPNICASGNGLLQVPTRNHFLTSMFLFSGHGKIAVDHTKCISESS